VVFKRYLIFDSIKEYYFHVQSFVREGAKVIATDINMDKLRELETLGMVTTIV